MKTLLEQADLETLKAMQLLDLDSLQGISDVVAQQVRTHLQSIVISGTSIFDAISELEGTSKKLTQHAQTYINTSRSQLSQKISDMEAENYDGAVFWEYFGAVLDDKTRIVCQEGLGAISSSYPNAPFFTDAEKKQFQSETMPRWNCRHEFVEITEDYYNEMTDTQPDTKVEKTNNSD